MPFNHNSTFIWLNQIVPSAVNSTSQFLPALQYSYYGDDNSEATSDLVIPFHHSSPPFPAYTITSGILFIIGGLVFLFGNISIIVATLAFRRLRRVRGNRLLLTLAVYDLVANLNTILSGLLQVPSLQWSLTQKHCMLLMSTNLWALCAGTLMTLFIGLDRLLTVVLQMYSNESGTSNSVYKSTTVKFCHYIEILLSAILPLPLILFSVHSSREGKIVPTCDMPMALIHTVAMDVWNHSTMVLNIGVVIVYLCLWSFLCNQKSKIKTKSSCQRGNGSNAAISIEGQSLEANTRLASSRTAQDIPSTPHPQYGGYQFLRNSSGQLNNQTAEKTSHYNHQPYYPKHQMTNQHRLEAPYHQQQANWQWATDHSRGCYLVAPTYQSTYSSGGPPSTPTPNQASQQQTLSSLSTISSSQIQTACSPLVSCSSSQSSIANLLLNCPLTAKLLPNQFVNRFTAPPASRGFRDRASTDNSCGNVCGTSASTINTPAATPTGHGVSSVWHHCKTVHDLSYYSRSIIAIAVVHIALWFTCMAVIRVLIEYHANASVFFHTTLYIGLLAMTNNGSNFFIYMFRYKQYRRAWQRLLRRDYWSNLFDRKRRRQTTTLAGGLGVSKKQPFQKPRVNSSITSRNGLHKGNKTVIRKRYRFQNFKAKQELGDHRKQNLIQCHNGIMS